MKKTYSAIKQQIAKLEAEAEALRKAEVKGVVERIKEAIKAYGLTPQELFGKSGSSEATKRPKRVAKSRKEETGDAPASSSSAPAKKTRESKPRNFKSYRDGDNSWSGRGPRPQWLRDALASGKSLGDFLV